MPCALADEPQQHLTHVLQMNESGGKAAVRGGVPQQQTSSTAYLCQRSSFWFDAGLHLEQGNLVKCTKPCHTISVWYHTLHDSFKRVARPFPSQISRCDNNLASFFDKLARSGFGIAER